MKNRGFAILQSPGFCGVHFSFSPSFSVMDYDCRSWILFAFFFLFALRHFSLFKAPWPQNRCFSDKFPESPAGRDRRKAEKKAEKEAGKRTWRERGSVWGIGQRGRGENGKRTGEKGRAWRKNKSGNGNRGRADRAETGACVFEQFSLRTAQTKGCSG